jgi:Ca-activated chloride channel homolog
MKKVIIGFLFLLIAGFAYADGLIIVDPPRHHPIIKRPIPLSVKYHKVKVDIEHNVATTTIDQVFLNEYDVDLEGTYIFPLPEEASITEFSMYIDGKKVSGKILKKDEARKIYEDIVRKMKDPGLLEYVGRNMFKARVYPIPKHGKKKMKLVYKQVLKYDAGSYKYVYPLDTEKYSPKPLEEASIAVEIDSSIPLKSVYSPSHKIDLDLDKYKATCGWEESDVKPDKNFVLYYTVSEKDVGLNLQTFREKGEDGYLLMLLSPGDIKKKAIAKDIIFVLDTSGSMSGKKIVQAREALKYCLNQLNNEDRFNIVSFSSSIKSYKDEFVRAYDKNVDEAIEFVKDFNASGGTNINEALNTSLKMFNYSQRPKIVVFLTDGEPTEGITDMKKIVANSKRANKRKARMFVFGVGNNVNTHLLDKLGEVHRGISDYVDPNEDIEVKVSAFYRKISSPVLSNISIDFGGIKVYDLLPKTMPDIFSGQQLVVLGRYKGDGDKKITLSGYVNGKRKKFVYEGRFEKADKANEFIPRLWATRKIGYLTSQVRLNGEKKELIDEIIRLSKKHGIMTQYTSYLILEKEDDYERYGISPAKAPKVRASGRQYSMDMSSISGAGAVKSAKGISSMKQMEQAAEPVLDTVKHVGGKTFYLREKVWTDAEYKKGMKSRKIKYLSKEYFQLIKSYGGISKSISVGKNVIVVKNGVAYHITE